MTQALTWMELCAQAVPGTRVVFVKPHDIFDITFVREGETGVVKENGLNDIWGGLLVLPDDLSLRRNLADWDGLIHLGVNEGLEPGEHPIAEDSAWNKESPIAIAPGGQWSGTPDPRDPDNAWIDDKTGECVDAHTGERTNMKLFLVTDTCPDDITFNRDLFVWANTPDEAAKHWSAYYGDMGSVPPYTIKIREVPTQPFPGPVRWDTILEHKVSV